MVHYEGLVRHLRPLRVHQAVSQQLQAGSVRAEPSWYRVVAAYPPSTTLVRTLPPQLVDRPTNLSRKQQRRKPKGLFKPQEIVYPEDALRKRFYKDHPWELARPRILVELDGRDASRYDWSQLRQPGRQLDGESVVQHQMWLMETQGLSEEEAYDVSRRKFYELRLQEDIERRIAREEAQHVGAQFPYTALGVNYQLERKFFEKWRVDAEAEVQRRRNKMAATSFVDEDEPGVDLALGEEGAEASA